MLFFVIREPNNFIIITSNYVGHRGLNPNTAKNKAKTIVAARWDIDFYWRGCEYDSDNQWEDMKNNWEAENNIEGMIGKKNLIKK